MYTGRLGSSETHFDRETKELHITSHSLSFKTTTERCHHLTTPIFESFECPSLAPPRPADLSSQFRMQILESRIADLEHQRIMSSLRSSPFIIHEMTQLPIPRPPRVIILPPPPAKETPASPPPPEEEGSPSYEMRRQIEPEESRLVWWLKKVCIAVGLVALGILGREKESVTRK